MRIELFYTSGCCRCTETVPELQMVARTIDPMIEWESIDVLQSIDRAVELGVLSVPALAVDGELAFATLPTADQLRRDLMRRLHHDRS